MVMRPRASAPCPSLLPLPGSTPLEELSAEARLKVAPGSGPSKKVAIEGTPSVTLEEEVAIEPLWLVVIAEIPPRIKEVIAEALSGAEDVIVEASMWAADAIVEAPSRVRDVI